MKKYNLYIIKRAAIFKEDLSVAASTSECLWKSYCDEISQGYVCDEAVFKKCSNQSLPVNKRNLSQLIFVMIKVAKTAVGSHPIGISTTCRNILLPHLPKMDLKHFISKLSSFLSAMVVTVYVSDAYVAVGSIRARYSLTLTLIVYFCIWKDNSLKSFKCTTS